MGTADGIIERTLSYPDVDARDRFNRLMGIDAQKNRLINILSILMNPSGLEAWGKKHHPDARHLVERVVRRPPLIVLAGDVGCGKTELAESVGDPIARQEKVDVSLLPLSLSSRGQGRVGEMTQLLSSAFDALAEAASKVKSISGKHRGGVILLVDEADALAQSREMAQMHHEDRAGVNAFIRGVDRIASRHLPAAVLMCTNRLSALDPAVRRRAADVLTFGRPDPEQRRLVFEEALSGLGFSSGQVADLVEATGAAEGRDYGFTFSDLTQRLLPAMVLDSYPHAPVTAKRSIEIARGIAPTAPFRDEGL